MANHPNRGWRRHASESADEWLSRWPWHTEPGARVMTDSELRAAMRDAYLAGYEARHHRDRPIPA